MKNVKLLLNKSLLKVRKHSPEILIGVGVVGTVASAVMACKATTKLQGILEDSNVKINTINECKNNETLSESYSEEDAKKDLTIVYTQTGIEIVKLYLPSVALGVVSLGCIISSNNILRKRNIALAAAYTSIDKSFKEYRKRVVDRFGEEVEYQLKHNIKAMEIEEVTIDENGKEVKTTKTVETCNIDGYSDYARFFDEGCSAWQNDPEYNLMFLKAQQQYANDLLKSKGHLFLNDVYEMLGLPISKAGQVVGWIYDPKNPIGDNFVDFGIYNANVQGYRNEYVNDTIGEERRDFVNGYKSSILLDFNVDGNIWDLM